MQKLGILLGTTIILTALVSTTFSFVLFQQFSAKETQEKSSPTAEFIHQTNKNTKPIALPGDFVTTAAQVTPATVNVSGERGNFRVSNGSGVIISDDGYIVTNYHVIEEASTYNITLNDKREFRAELVGIDPTTDLALLKISATNLPMVRFGNSDAVRVGEWVLAIGNPFNLTSTVTAGIVSAKARSINILSDRTYSIESFIQTDAVVNPGNSGGGLVNARGELVGINSAILTETGVYEGYSFAIPSNLVEKVMNDLRKYGEVQRAILGVSINNVDDDLASQLGLSSVRGVVIASINPSSSADEAGLQVNDVILKVNDFNVNSTSELQERVARYSPGDYINIEYIRRGKVYQKRGVKLQSLRRGRG